MSSLVPEDHLWSSGLGSAAHAWLPAVGAGHTTLTPNHTAVFSIQKMNAIQFSVGTSELITFNESSNLKELSVYSVLSAAWLGHHSACSAGSNSSQDTRSILQAGTALETVF